MALISMSEELKCTEHAIYVKSMIHAYLPIECLDYAKP